MLSHPHAVLPAAQAADTLVVVSAPTGLETAAQISAVVVGLFFLLILPVLFVLFLQLRKLQRTVRELGEKGLQRADPLLQSGKAVADNLEFVSLAIRQDVERVSNSVKSLSERLQQASDRMEERIVEFNALMEVVQREAEDIFVGTAATVRGVRVGARALTGGPEREGSEDERQLPLPDPEGEPLEEPYLGPREAGR